MILVLPMFILLNNNPIYSLLALIFTFINFSFVLFNVGLEFLALAYLIVYVGAICVLFIFVILLLNLRSFNYTRNNPSLILVFFFLTLILNFNETTNYADFSSFTEYNSDLELFAISLFQYQYQYFILAGLLLLLAIIACIYLTLNANKNKKINYYYYGE